jgi:uncharacterized protein (DUF362 family)/Pyruvate/2-oxoacid:ferredoxin oxidoreductase delta subunit
VESALRESLNLLGGIDRFVEPGQRVCLKVNLLAAAKPERAVTTHPAVIEAVVNLVREAGGEPFIADSPGAGVPYTQAGLRRVYRETGLLDLAERTGVELNWDTTVLKVSLPRGRMVKRLDVIKPVVAADQVIAIPKLKTHVFTTFTGATKILFGVVPGLAKPGYHAKLADSDRFAEMLLDIVDYIRPGLFVMDGVLAMEGDGPGSHGKARQSGLLLASPNAVSMDVVACQVIGANPRQVPMLRAAEARGWWDGSPQGISVLGQQIEEVAIHNFRLPQTHLPGNDGLVSLSLPARALHPLFKPALTPRVVPQREKCTACRTCVRGCPQGAISVVDGLAMVDDSACIRCYCCHELCPESAIKLEFSWLGRLVRRSGALGRLETDTASTSKVGPNA